MAWNDKNNQNPWGGNNQTPPELDEVIKDFKNKFNTRFGGGSSGKGGVSKAAKGSFKYFVILAVLLWLLSIRARIGAFLTRLNQYIRSMWNKYVRQKLVSEISRTHLTAVLSALSH